MGDVDEHLGWQLGCRDSMSHTLQAASPSLSKNPLRFFFSQKAMFKKR